MPNADELEAAVEAGILEKEQAGRLSSFLAARRAAAPTQPDGERLKFLRSFQDIFLTLGIALVTVGTAFLFGGWIGPLCAAVVALILAWLLVSKRRLVLPSMALALSFVAFSGIAVERNLALAPIWMPESAALLAPAVALVAALFYFTVFRLPFSLGLAAGAAALAVFEATALYAPDHAMAAILASGLVVFAAAMSFDARDPNRAGPSSDIAFWLHLVAAPLVVHGTIRMVVDVGGGRLSLGEALLVLGVLVAIGFVAVVIDRRALLVSGLAYLGYAVASLLSQATGGAIELAGVLVLLGLIVLGLALGWRPIRHVLLGRLPRRGLLLYLPPAGIPNT